MSRTERLEELFHQRGLRVTPQRRHLFQVLERIDGHQTAEAVWKEVRGEMPMVSLKTVYDILHELATMGEIEVVDLGTGSMRFDLNTSPHHHLVCESCGSIRDLPAGQALPEVGAEQDGFQITRVEVILRGLCENCRQSRLDEANSRSAE